MILRKTTKLVYTVFFILGLFNISVVLAQLNPLDSYSGRVIIQPTLGGMAAFDGGPDEVEPKLVELISSEDVNFIDAGNLTFSVGVDQQELEELAEFQNRGLIEVVPDLIMEPFLTESISLIGANVAYLNGYTGKGQTIAILDTGVDATHPFLTNKVVRQACFSTNDSDRDVTSLCPNGLAKDDSVNSAQPCSFNKCEHGTHVAGIAAGQNNDFTGVAKDADIVAIQVFSRVDNAKVCKNQAPCLRTYTSDVIRALRYIFDELILTEEINISSINMSLGGSIPFSNVVSCDRYYDQIGLFKTAQDLRSLNVAIIAASGNGGFISGVSGPACVSSIVSVGATADKTTFLNSVDTVSRFTNRGDFLDLLAPGSSITSAVLNSAYAGYQGTSMASPHVAGAWALMSQANPEASIEEILEAFKNTGIIINDEPISSSGQTFTYEFPRIQVDEALSYLLDN